MPELRLKPVPFTEAIAWAAARKVELPDIYYGERQGFARAQAFSVAGMAGIDQLQLVLDSLVESLVSGESFGKWKKRVAAGEIPLDLPPHRIENIFRTNTQGHYARGRCEQQGRNKEVRPWLLYDAVSDSRTRPSHAAMDGFVARYDDPVWRRIYPPNGYNCFLPSTRVEGDFRVGLKAFYSGEAVEVVTAQGLGLSVTVNHPVLTGRGWVAAGNLKEGDDLLRYGWSINGHVPAPPAWKPLCSPLGVDDEKRPPTVEQVFDALASQRLGVAERSAFDLYGDALRFEGDVQVVGADSVLMDGVGLVGGEGGKDVNFDRGNHGAIGARDKKLHASGAPFFARFGKVVTKHLKAFFHERRGHFDFPRGLFSRPAIFEKRRKGGVMTGNFASPGSIPSSGALSQNGVPAFFKLFPFQRFSFASAAQDDAVALQPISYGLPGCVKVVRDRLQAFAARVSLLQPRRIVRSPSRGLDRPARPDGVSLLRRASFHAAVAQQSVKKAITDVSLFKDLAHSCAGQIKVDKVAGVRHFSFSGHVYDFETDNGLIAANGIITSNCRCRAIALSDAQAERFSRADNNRHRDDPEESRARLDALIGGPDKGWDYHPCQDAETVMDRVVAEKTSTLVPVLSAALLEWLANPPEPPEPIEPQ